MLVALPGVAAAQTPVATPTTPESTRVGVTIFADYSLTESPKVTDANGKPVTSSAFNLTRSYINLTGQITPRISFRLTPDMVKNTDSNSSLSGNLVVRIKYAFAQARVGNDTVLRLGVQPTPLIDGQEGVYRYRFQGTSFVEREGGLNSSDVGLTVMKPLPKGFGDVHTGFYNGEGYTKSEVNDQKAFMTRVTLKPLRNHATLKGLRLIGYYHHDNYVKGAPRKRAAASAMFEHKRFNAGLDFLQRVDQPSPASTRGTGRGVSFFVTPFFREKGRGLEGLFRFDSFEPNVDVAGKRNRVIAGLAYWFPKQGPGTAALLGHVEQVRPSAVASPIRTTERRFTLNMLITF